MTLAQFLKNHTSLAVIIILTIIVLIVSWKYIFVGIFAASLAVVGMPLYRKLLRKVPVPLASFAVTTLISAIITGIFSSVVVILVKNMNLLSEMIQVILVWFGEIFGIDVNPTTGWDIVNSLMSMITPQMAISVISTATFVIIACILFYAVLYLFFIFGDRIIADIRSVIPTQALPNMLLMGNKVKDVLFSLYIVHVFIAFLTFLLALPYSLLLGVGFETAIFYSMLCGIFALIPVVGPIVVIIFLALYFIATGQWYQLILTATLGYFLTCILTDMILRPRLTAKSVKIRPMLMFVGFFGGAAAIGLPGFILGPVLLVLGMVGYEIFFKEMRHVKREIDAVDDPKIFPESQEDGSANTPSSR